MKNRFFRIICVFTCIVLLCQVLCGCSDTVADAELRLPLSAEPTTLDPQIAQSSESRTIVFNCFEGLMKLNAEGSPVPAAAKNVSASPDGLTFSFELHTDKKWHINSNHEEIFGENWENAIDLRVTADDFVFGLQRALSPETGAPDAKRLYMIKNAEKVHTGKLPANQLGVTATDEFTVRIELEYTSNEFFTLLAEPVAMPCNRAFFEATGGRHGLAAPYILCNGPFYLSRWYEKSSIVLRRNPDNIQNCAKVYSVTYAFTTDEEIILQNFEDNKYAAACVSPALAQTLSEQGCTITPICNGVWGLAFNCSDLIMMDTKLRLALVKSLDFNLIRECTDSTDYALSIIPPSCIINGIPFDEAAPQLGYLGYDETGAKKLYSEFSLADSCEFTVLCTQEYETAVRKIIQNWQQLFGIGFSAKVEVLDKASLQARVNSGNFQCAFTEIITSAQTPVEFLSSFRDGGGIFRFNSAGFNKLIAQLNTTPNAQSAIDGCMKAQEYLIQNAVFNPLYYSVSYVATASNIKGINISHSGNVIKLDDTEQMKH